jgi:hypothetical protein
MRNVAGALALAVMFSPAATAAQARSGPAAVQDPPGRIAVDQPAAVTFSDRDTPRDTTDPMHGKVYADLRAAGRTPAGQPRTIVTPPDSPAASDQPAGERGTESPRQR